MPSVPRKVARPAPVDGAYSETPVCVPIANAAMLVATATAEPPEEPSDDFDGLKAFQTWPKLESLMLPELANCDRFALPIRTAPASRSLPTWKASSCGT